MKTRVVRVLLIFIANLTLILLFSVAAADPSIPIPPPDEGFRDRIELLTNESFDLDVDSDKIPDQWTGISTTTTKADKLKCDHPETNKFFAHTGGCAFMFSGNPNGTASSIQQIVSDTSAFINGAEIIFNTYIDPRNAVPGTTFGKAQIKYSNSTKQKLTLKIPSNTVRDNAVRGVSDYVLVTDSLTLAIPVGATIKSVKIQFTYGQTAGKFLVDDASFVVSSESPTATPSETATSTAALPTVTETANASVTIDGTATFTDTPSATITGTLSDTPFVTDTPSASVTVSPSEAPSNTSTDSPTPSVTPTITATSTLTSTLTPILASTPTPVTTNAFLIEWTKLQSLDIKSYSHNVFGDILSINENATTALIGAYDDGIPNTPSQFSGAAYVFIRTGNTWTQQAKLVANDRRQSHQFGSSVALSDDGNTALIGEINNWSPFFGDTGRAYIFTRNATGVWMQSAMLTASDGVTRDCFGGKVALSGDGKLAIVLASGISPNQTYGSGAVYVFSQNAEGIWSQQAQLRPDASDGFIGGDLALSQDGNTLLIASGATSIGENYLQGTVYVMTRNPDGTWTRQTKLTHSDPQFGDYFGSTIALSANGNTAAISTTRNSAYVFTRSGGVWQEQTKLIPQTSDFIYRSNAPSLSMSDDGQSILITRIDTSIIHSSSVIGEGYLFTLGSGGTWTQQWKLRASDLQDFTHLYFGGTGVLSGENGKILISSEPGVYPGTPSYAAYYFDLTPPFRSTATYTPTFTLTPTYTPSITPTPDPALLTTKLIASDGYYDDAFGASVAYSSDGNTALVGAPNHYTFNTGAGTKHGAGYIFVRENGVWTQQATLLDSEGGEYDNLGYKVALSGDGNTAFLIARYDYNGENIPMGSVLVFTRDGATWTQQAKFTANAGMWDEFGDSMATNAVGDLLLVGSKQYETAHRFVYVFKRNGNFWTQQTTLTPSDAAANSSFGLSLDLSDDGSIALIGASEDNNGANLKQGSVYVFTQSNDLWTQQTKFTSSDGATDDGFGWMVTLSGDGSTALVAICGNVNHVDGCNNGYIFSHIGNTWTQQTKFTSDTSFEYSFYGWSLALNQNGTVALIADPYAPIGANYGQAYVYQRSLGGWSLAGHLFATDGVGWPYFGSSVALSADGNFALIGAAHDTIDTKTGQGSVYPVDLSQPYPATPTSVPTITPTAS